MLDQLDSAIRAVCPIHGVSGNGRIDYRDEATQEQRAAAQAVADQWDFAAKGWKPNSHSAADQAIRRRNAALEAAAVIVEGIDSTEDPVLLAIRELVLVLMKEIQSMKSGKPKPSQAWNDHKQATAQRLRGRKF